MSWFRVDSDMLNDPKIGTLSDSEHRTWIELLCLACKENKSGCTGLTLDQVNWALRRNVSETFQKLLCNGLVHLNSAEKVVITNWEKRQFPSDKSTKRVQEFRSKK